MIMDVFPRYARRSSNYPVSMEAVWRPRVSDVALLLSTRGRFSPTMLGLSSWAHTFGSEPFMSVHSQPRAFQFCPIASPKGMARVVVCHCGPTYLLFRRVGGFDIQRFSRTITISPYDINTYLEDHISVQQTSGLHPHKSSHRLINSRDWLECRMNNRVALTMGSNASIFPQGI